MSDAEAAAADEPKTGATGSVPAAASLEALAEISAAVEGGAGLHEVVRAVARGLGAGVAVLDAALGVLAVACRSPEEERAVLAQGTGVGTLELRVAERRVGELRFRPRDGSADASAAPEPDAVLRMAGS
jgi:hypothetical protein